MDTRERLIQEMEQCREAYGINYVILMQKNFENYLHYTAVGNLNEAIEAAFNILEPIQKQQDYLRHKYLSELFIQDVSKIGVSPNIADLYRPLALTCDILTEYADALKAYDTCFAILHQFEHSNDPKVWWYYASLWYNRAQHDKSGETREQLTEYTQNAIKFYEYLNDRHGLSLSYNRLSTLLPEDQIPEKIVLLNKVVALNEGEGGSIAAMALAQINIGYYEINLGNVEQGLSMMRLAVSVIEQHTNTRYAGLSYMFFAKALINAKRYQEALDMNDYAHSIFSRHKVVKHLQEAEEQRAQIQQLMAQHN